MGNQSWERYEVEKCGRALIGVISPYGNRINRFLFFLLLRNPIIRLEDISEESERNPSDISVFIRTLVLAERKKFLPEQEDLFYHSPSYSAKSRVKGTTGHGHVSGFLPPLSLPRSLSIPFAIASSLRKISYMIFSTFLPIYKMNLVLGDRFHNILNEFIVFRVSSSRTETL